ncbi:hypothetical protein K227x_33530 [Rubripirellula lacrimiformis]|uniref:Tetratricopeptide repeat protein n=1 Tax=Rubripirellula lacrimiformis TaxID=1930273 RepID=A0A517NCU2_9BACT|nr:tetratricopeptide repeat protein [Rubripirellula lacrimiformis]QDT04955.1 hypothetical protein K227x_33530 [Rubripirellula lacrimiformis]
MGFRFQSDHEGDSQSHQTPPDPSASGVPASSSTASKAAGSPVAADQTVIDAAWDLYFRGELAAAADLLGTIVDPTHGDRLQLLGLVLHDLGQPYEAADAIEQASLIRPVRDEVRIALASCYAQLRRIDLARELYLQLALPRKLPAPLMLQVAAGLEAIDSPQLAMQVCQWITEQDESVAQAYYDMGFYSARSGHPLYLTEALTHRALQLDPANVHYRIGLVSLLVQLDRDNEAYQAFAKLAPSDIAKVTCVSCLGRIADMLDRQGHPPLSSACRTQADRLRVPKRTTANVDPLNDPLNASPADVARADVARADVARADVARADAARADHPTDSEPSQ